MKEENLNHKEIQSKREKVEKKLKEDGARRVTNRGEDGSFVEGSHLRVTAEQIENARKEMQESLKPISAKIEENKEKIEELERKYIEKGYPDEIERRILELEKSIKNKEKKKRIQDIEKRRKKLIEDLEDLEKEADPKGIRLRSNEAIENEAVQKEGEIKDIEKEKEKLINELEEKLGEKTENKKARLKKAREIDLEDLEKIGEGDEIDSEQSPEMKRRRERMKEYEKETEKVLNQETKKREGETANPEKETDKKEREEEEKEENLDNFGENLPVDMSAEEAEDPEKEEEQEKEEGLDNFGENLPVDMSAEEAEETVLDLAEHLEKKVYGETNKSILKKSWKKARNLMGAVGGAVGLKKLVSTVPGVSEALKSAGIRGTMASGAIAGVGLKLGSYGLEAWDETKKYEGFKENLDEEIESIEGSSEEYIKEKMADLNTNISIVEERVKELQREFDHQKEKYKEEKDWFFQKAGWLFQEERSALLADIKKHKKVLEVAKNEFRYLSVELKEREPGTDIKNLAKEMVNGKKEQLREMQGEDNPHGSLANYLLVTMEGTESKMGDETKQQAELMKKIEYSETGLKAKLEQENRSVAKEILISAGLVAALAPVAESIIQSEAVQEQFEKIGDWVTERIGDIRGSSTAEVNEFKEMIEGVTEFTEKRVLETIDEITEKEINYMIESGDSVWSVTEEFLTEGMGEEFTSLDEAKKTYVIDHITTAIESSPEEFGLELGEGETIDLLFADSNHTIDFSPLLDGELEIALQRAESLSTEEVANILENNEKIGEFISDHQQIDLSGETIIELETVAEDLTEEKIAEELIVDELRSESLSATEQLTSIENWLEDMQDGKLNEAHFDFMADTSEGGQRELWVEQLSRLKGVTYEEMEVILEESFAEISAGAEAPGAESVASEAVESSPESFSEEVAEWKNSIENNSLTAAEYETLLESGNEELIEEIAEKRDSTPEETRQLINERIEEIKQAEGEAMTSSSEMAAEESAMSAAETVEEEAEEIVESSVEKEIYQMEGYISPEDRMLFFENFRNHFGNENVNSIYEIVEALMEDEVSPQEFIDWVEDGAFDKTVAFGTEHPPKEVLVNDLENSINLLNEAEREAVYKGRLRAMRMKIRKYILYGK